MNATDYKKYHEAYMQNNHGTTFLHTFLCLFFTVQCSLYISIHRQNKSELIQYIFEYLIMVLPMIVAHTVLPEHICLLILFIMSLIAYKVIKIVLKQNLYKVFMTNNKFRTQRINSISCMRGLTYLITVCCILAVDFREFPRYLAKTERFGYSLMDTGVGLFVLMSGIVHKDIRKDNYLSVMRGNLKFVTILLILGIARFLSLKQLDYQEHVTEYGVHWNFFFTLAVCKLLASILLCVSNSSLIFSIVTLSLHEIFLHNGLQKWVFSDTPRVSFIEANREGIASSLGYVSMYLFSAHLKTVLNNQLVPRHVILIKLTGGSLILCFMSYLFNIYSPTSRTLANAGYCLYLECILMIVMTLMYILEALSQDKECNIHFEVPLTLSAINKNGLIYFLIANLTTGVINLSIQTLLVPAFITFTILNVYMIFTITTTIYLNKYGITI